jgi:WD40 repeat protein
VQMGTAGYMSPEQVRGLASDARSDIFSFGVVLYELLSGRHPFRRDTRPETQVAILRDEPPGLSGVGLPLSLERIVRRCLEKRSEDRFHSAHDLALALESVGTGAVEVLASGEVEERSPYPGLASFTEADADVFFGREAEIEALWEKVRQQKLLALIGPSGAGKTSFLRAGVVPSRPDGWAAVVVTPGRAPAAALARGLAPELVSDPQALQDLIGYDDPDVLVSLSGRWRKAHKAALLVVDQFEELFTLNPAETQGRFAALIGRLAAEVDVHVLLSLRDDFLMRCHDYGALAPVFDGLTPLGTLTGDALRRAVVEPAKKEGYAFEDTTLVDEMLTAVGGERGALPLLAFALSRLWEKRDREWKVLTRAAYQQIGGVSGALAQHAEAVLERIGANRERLVREVFRNLVTSQGTRAACEREELLSAFPDRAEAEGVVRQLIDARLLTSYEVEGKEGDSSYHRIEIVHESLLRAWPRLVRWQAQDEEGAVLRDQLKQAAHLWHEKGRTNDLLWTGTAFREFELWRERYPGALTALEEDFANAMRDRALRRKRQRRLVVVSILATAVVAAAVTGALWRRSALAHARAEAEALRAEARKLIALGRAELDGNPSAALAFAQASLEVADSREARQLAVHALWSGPPALVAATEPTLVRLAFSPDGRRLASAGFSSSVMVLDEGGGEPLRITGLATRPDLRGVAFTSRGDRLLSWLQGDPSIRIWSMTGQEVGVLAGEAQELLVLDEDRVATYGAEAPGTTDRAIRVWSLRDMSPRRLATWRPPLGFRVDLIGLRPAALDPALGLLAYGSDRGVRLLDLAGPDAGRVISLGMHEAKVREVAFAPDGLRLVSVDENGGFRLWSVSGRAATRKLDASAPRRYSAPAFDQSGSKVGWASGSGAQVWNLVDPPDALPRQLRGRDLAELGAVAFGPSGQWAAAGPSGELYLWFLASPYPRILRGLTQPMGPNRGSLAFTADSAFLASCARDGARLWPLTPEGGRQRLVDLGADYFCYSIAADATSPSLLIAAPVTGAFLVRPDGTPPKKLAGIPPTVLDGAARNTRAGLAAVGVNYAPDAKDMVIHLAHLDSGTTRAFPTRDPASRGPFTGNANSLGFAADGSLVSGGRDGVYRLDLATGARSKLCDAARRLASVALNRSGDSMIALLGDGPPREILIVDPVTGTERRITSHTDAATAVAMDGAGERIATGDRSGAVRVGRVTGEEPHLLLGHGEAVSALAFSPDGKWVASASGTEIRLWPMPDLSKPPLHTLAHDDLVAKLKSLTNLRAVRDPTSATGWKIELGPFPGWKHIPTW